MNNFDDSKLDRQKRWLFCSVLTSSRVVPIAYLGDVVRIAIISRPCIQVVKIIRFCTVFCNKLGQKNEEQWPGFEFKEIITIFSCHVYFLFFTRVLGSSFCCVLSSLMPTEQGQGMTMEWCSAED